MRILDAVWQGQVIDSLSGHSCMNNTMPVIQTQSSLF